MKLFNSLLLLLIITSCQFFPDDTYYAEIPEPESPEIEVIELSLDKDTIFLTDFKDINIHFSAGNHSILEVAVLIDGEEKYVGTNYRDNFTILASDLNEGIHKLSFSVITNANNGSIADMLGYEGFQFFSNEWILICIKNDKRAGFINRQTENGKLKLSWEAHNKINFKSYLIEKRYHKSSGGVKEFRTSDPWVIDEAYVGEKAYYDIYTHYYSGAGYEFHWAEIEIENTLPVIRIRRNELNYEVYWENNAFSQGVKNYRLIDLASPADTVLLYEGAPSPGNQYVIPGAVFGNEIHYRLVSVPANADKRFNNDDVYYLSTPYQGLIGEKSISYRKIAATGKDNLLVLKDNYIYRYIVSDGKFADSLTYNWTHCGIAYGGFSLSPGKNYFTAVENCTKKLVLMSPDNLSGYSSYPINHIITQGMEFNSLPVSDNGIVLAKDYGGVHVYDVLQDKKIGSVLTNEYIDVKEISSMGNYFAIKSSILRFYKIVNQEIIPVWESDLPYKYNFTSFAYDPENSDNLILHDGNTLFHKNAADFTTVKSFPLTEENILNIDFATRRLLAYSTGRLAVYSIDNGEQVFRSTADPRVNMSQHSCLLYLNTIYLKDGVCLPLPE